MLSPSLPVGGRVWAFRSFWANLALDRLVQGILDVGYKIPFFSRPRFAGVRSTPLVGQYASVLLEEVSALLQKHAIEPVLENRSEGFYSTYFLVPKKTGDLRPILNLKPINGLVVSPSFKMETLTSVVRGLCRGDWMASLDLKDAYFHIPIHPDCRKFLRFCIQDQCYQYRVLPFGLTTSPRIFTKFLAPLMGALRLQGIRTFPYLDDVLFTAESRPLLLEQLRSALRMFTQAGFIVNLKKSALTPVQDLVFLGARLQTAAEQISLPLVKAEKLVELVLSFEKGQSYPARRWLQLLGVLASTILMVRLARLRMRPIQWYFHSQWNSATHCLSFPVKVNAHVHGHLLWWTLLDNLLSGLPLFPMREHCVVTTDASSLGWGGVLAKGAVQLTVQGRWTFSQQEWHINYKELMAVFLSLQEFRDQVQNGLVLIRSDNTTTCAYINKGGGDQVPQSVPAGHTAVGLVSSLSGGPQGGPCPRSSEHSCGLSVQTRSRSERVEPALSGGPSPVLALGSPLSGFVCDLPQLQGSHLLLPLPVPGSAGSGRFFHKLEQLYSGLCLPAGSVAGEGSSEGQVRPGVSDVNCSPVAHEVMVRNSAGPSSGHSVPAPFQAGSPVTVSDSSSRSVQDQTGGLESQRRTLRAEGFSDQAIGTILQSRASSTVAGYNAKWSVFIRWCHGRSLDPHKSSVADICDFLQHKLDEGLQWQTLKGYVAAISACHRNFTTTSLGQDKRIVQFLKGTFRVRPPVKPIVPAWSLHVVLQALGGAPFEPLATADLKYLTWKTTFLLAVTSAARVSELQALDSNPDLSRVSKYSALLRLNPAFIPKSTVVEYLNREIELEALFPNPSTLEQKAMHKHCPVRALLYYIQRSKAYRKDSQLLVSYKSGQTGGKVTKSTLARWIRDTIVISYKLMGKSIPTTSVKAHSTRAVASSLADLKGVSPSDLCRAATWSSPCVFAKHYRLNLAASKSISTQVLSAAVAGNRS